MVEMVETATILRQATPRSLVILDEVGRGTATYDGLSIAWAVIEHLHEAIGARSLIATHYHELTALAAKLGDLACYTVRTKEWQGEVRFLHEVAPGAADRSYGVHVARLAGLPAPVLARAEEVLATLERCDETSAVTRLACDLPLFAAARTAAAAPAAAPARSPALARLAAINPDALTPRQALDLLYELKALLE
jgi:DNA mismatch repair protein MutS